MNNSGFTLGIINSYVLDFVLRKLITINVNQTYLKQLPIPRFEDTNYSKEIAQIVKYLLVKNILTNLLCVLYHENNIT